MPLPITDLSPSRNCCVPLAPRIIPERFNAFNQPTQRVAQDGLHDSCENGMDFTLKDNKGQTALHCCIPRDPLQTMRVLLDRVSALETTNSGHQSKRLQAFINHQRTDSDMTARHDLSKATSK